VSGTRIGLTQELLSVRTTATILADNCRVLNARITHLCVDRFEVLCKFSCRQIEHCFIDEIDGADLHRNTVTICSKQCPSSGNGRVRRGVQETIHGQCTHLHGRCHVELETWSGSLHGIP
jgi:hypothetical protein